MKARQESRSGRLMPCFQSQKPGRRAVTLYEKDGGRRTHAERHLNREVRCSRVGLFRLHRECVFEQARRTVPAVRGGLGVTSAGHVQAETARISARISSSTSSG